jgi:chromosome segregation ATPase
MKRLVLLLSVACVALAGMTVLRTRRTGDQIRAAHSEILFLSNRLAEAEMKLNHQERMNASLGSSLTNRINELNSCASRLARVQEALARSRVETGTAREELETATSKVLEANTEAASAASQLEELKAEDRVKEVQVQEAQERMRSMEIERVALSQRLAQCQEAMALSNRQLNNPDFLRAQLVALRRQPSGSAMEKGQGEPDFRLPLELLSDGSVRLAAPATNSSFKF